MHILLKRIIVLVSLLLIISYDIMSQSYTLKHLGVEDGLSNNYIADIAQDGQGFIWIATESGLNRFDGKNFMAYTKNNSDLISNELNTLLYDEEENSIWIGSQRDGISIFNCHSQAFENFTIDDYLSTNDVTHLSLAADGGIWITHYHVGVDYYDKKAKKFVLFADKDIEGMKSQNWCSLDDGNGHLYVGHRYDGLSIIDIKNRTARNFRHNPNDPRSLPGNEVRTIFIDHQKNIWIGTNKGLSLFNPQTEEFIVFRHDPTDPNSLGSDQIHNIKEMKNGDLWITTDMYGVSILNLNNITLIDPQKVVFRNIIANKNPKGLASSNVRVLFQDSYENIWIGHYGRGIDFISSRPLAFHSLNYSRDKQNEINEKPIWDIHLDKYQQLWIGSENEVSFFQYGQLKKVINIRSYLSKDKLSVYINKIQSDKEGFIWLGTNNSGVLKLNPRTEKAQVLSFTEKGGVINSFYEDENQKMWIGTDNGLYSYSNNEMDKEELINGQLQDKTIYSILRDRKGRLWIGTFGKGIFIFENNNTLLKNLSTDKGFCSNAINSLFLDSKGRVWVATRNGLVYFNDMDTLDQYAVYDENQGLENSHIRAIQEDKNGNIWISTNTGISLWDKEKERFNNYNYQDGVPMGDFTNGSVGMSEEGILYFGSLNDICYFNPFELTKEQQEVTPVQITGCLALNKQIENKNKKVLVRSEENKINLPYDQNSFYISFSNPNYSQNQQVEYAYMMEGLDNIWYNTQGENQVTFRNISPGKYTFKLKSRLKNQNWDEENIATLDFVIHQPLWSTWYAKLFYILLVVCILFFVLRSYKRKVNLKTSLKLERQNSQNKEELNDERLRFYTNITHELRTPLTLIIGPLEDLIHDPDLPEFYSKKINVIHASAIRLLNLINQILEFRKTETQNRKLTVSKGNLASLVTETGLRFKELNQNDKVDIYIEVENKEINLYFDSDMITTILNNLLSNAMKYTPSGEIRLSLRTCTERNNQYAEIAVSDTGYGINQEDLPRIFDRYYQVRGKQQSSGTGIGLALVKSLTELHEGLLFVESAVGKGTTFRFRILTQNTYPDALHSEDNTSVKAIEDDSEMVYEDSQNTHPVVLVVEDDKDIREYIIESLQEDYRVFSAVNGKEGLAMALKYIPNMIVCDIMMPEMNGIELCRKIKEDVLTSHIPVILLTAKDSIHDREEGYTSGADSYITKPFSARLLRSRIHNLLESRKKLAEQINIQANGKIDQENKSKKEKISISKLDEEFLNKLTDIIESNIGMEGLDISFIKTKMNMSHSTFYRKVKGLTGISANEFIRKVKLRNSYQLLLMGHNVSEVAYMSGFNDIAYFRKCFKEEYGLSPSEYIKSHKK